MNRISQVAALLSAAFLPVSAATVFLTNDENALLRIDSATPEVILSSVSISGLSDGESIVGLDFRPANAMLYALSSSSRLYTLDTTTGAASPVGMSGEFSLSGTAFGFDFNPVPDRVRVTSDSSQNLRLNPNDRKLAATDGGLTYASGDINFGTAADIVGSAYTNSQRFATSTTLYGIDSSLGILVTQNPPNDGILNTIGSLGVTTTEQVGFDILPVSGIAFASLTSGASSSLYTINLSTGAASLVGILGDGSQTITGLAAVSDVPEPSTIGLTAAAIGALTWWRRKQLGES